MVANRRGCYGVFAPWAMPRKGALLPQPDPCGEDGKQRGLDGRLPARLALARPPLAQPQSRQDPGPGEPEVNRPAHDMVSAAVVTWSGAAFGTALAPLAHKTREEEPGASGAPT